MSSRYTKSHEWARDEANGIYVGISDYAQSELGDVVFVELPEIGHKVSKGEAFATVESVKAASEIYSPLDGTVIKVNEQLSSQPELINSSAEKDAWIALIVPRDRAQLDSLMSEEEYAVFLKQAAK